MFHVFVGILYDFGDAPDTYHTSFNNNGAVALVTDGFHLGSTATDLSANPPLLGPITEESDAFLPPQADAGDDGVTFNKLAIFQPSQITVDASAAGKIDMWLDLDHDGTFSDSFDGSGQNARGHSQPRDRADQQRDHVPARRRITQRRRLGSRPLLT